MRDGHGLGFRRRRFLQTASALGLGAGLGSWDRLKLITPLDAAEAKVTPDIVRFRPEIEPIVRWIEETPRDKIFDRTLHRKQETNLRTLALAIRRFAG